MEARGAIVRLLGLSRPAGWAWRPEQRQAPQDNLITIVVEDPVREPDGLETGTEWTGNSRAALLAG